MFSMIRNAHQQREYEQLRNRKTEIPQRTLPSPEPGEQVADPFQREAARAEELLDAQAGLAAGLFATQDLQARVADAARELIGQGIAPEDAWSAAMEMVATIVRGGQR